MLTWQNTGDPCTPETLTFVNHLMPTRIGYTTALGTGFLNGTNPSITATVDTGYSPRGLSYFDATGTQQLIFTLSKKIYRYPGNTDISRAAAYTNGYFSFAQYRDKIYGVNGADLLQKSTTGAFADVAGNQPKLTRIAVAGEYMAGIGLAANFTRSDAVVVSASPYLVMISAVGNPEQFDPSVDTTAFYQDIVDTGGPLTTIVRLRDFFVVFQRSGVYVIEQNPDPAIKWQIRCVSDYFGCEWPDSVIEVNNVLYWISPTRSGEVCAFDGSQITVLSQALKSTIVDTSNVYVDSGFVTGTNAELEGGLTAATDGETIVWSRFVSSAFGIPDVAYSKQLYLNIATGRFGYSDRMTLTSSLFGVFSNAWQNGMLTVKCTQLSAGANKFQAGYLTPLANSDCRVELYRGSNVFNKISNATLRFSEYVYPKEMVTELAKIGGFSTNALPAYTGTPSMIWASTKNSGDAISYPTVTAASAPSATWNTNTSSIDISASSIRGQSARTFAFVVFVQPVNSLTGITIDYAPAGNAQAGAKAGAWQ